MSAIARSYNPPRIVRPPTLNIYDDIRAGEKALSSFGKKYVVPAAKTAGKELLKVPGKALPVIGQGVGLTAGLGATYLTGNPELAPYLGGAGAFAGKKGGEYLKKKLDTAIDRL